MQQGKPGDSVKKEENMDLRQQHPLEDPALLAEAYKQSEAAPMSPRGTAILRFDSTENHNVRLRRWLWWKQLARLKIYVKDLLCVEQMAVKYKCHADGNLRARGGSLPVWHSDLDTVRQAH